MLTKSQIQQLLRELTYETVYEDPGLSGVRLQRKRMIGYSDDDGLANIQAALSVMLEGSP